MDDEPRMVKADVFKKWWRTIDEMCDKSRNDKVLENSQGVLRVIGMKSGAIRAVGSGFDLDPDWPDEEINFAIDPQDVLIYWLRYDPETFIATIINQTRIPE